MYASHGRSRLLDCPAMRDDAWAAHLEALGALLRARRVAAGLSLRELSRRTAISNAYLSQLERGHHDPSLRVLRAVASALDLPLGTLLVRAGILDADDDAAPTQPDVEAAIRADPALSEPQRVALLSVYRSFMAARLP
jgi:transcriptional regulator with XRE-family HTH domain